MSDEPGTPGTPTPGPRPEEIRFFGTTWVDHSGNYGLRRAGVGLGALVLAAAGCFVLRFAYQGLAMADVGSFVSILLIAAFAICSALAYNRTWAGFSERPDPEKQAALRGFMAIGFVGVLVAYALRCLTEAPGEKLRRREYETAQEQYERRTTRRTGNPAKKKSGGKRKN
ncbi:EamA/RhaT family transporter [Streptomyces sp. VRA16 Mangrove soil]|uniref:EamA/RhaT family transporter n=1 Tax=Streptomyces sp. VRA16 Mangrove soil TaxID=2817434 RepID=UPI001A9D3F40|nr:EamA/RhaT family transporter [Streptomyces sp. VRA16 Mangrove soil]MBO1333913.1 EamA/RhaT family transporter [Streptomyces sp. VRA16 Mangrove soil]